jgi:hypothetical protein
MISCHESACGGKFIVHAMEIYISRQNYLQMTKLLKRKPLLHKMKYPAVN